MSRTRILVAGLVAFAVAAACYLVIWRGAEDGVAAAETRLDEVTNQESVLRARLRAADEFAEHADASQVELDALRAAVPDQVDLAGFVAQHDAMARDSWVVVESLTPDEPDATPLGAPAGTTSTGIEVTVNGAPAAIQAYMRGLDELPREVAVDEVEMTNEGSNLVGLRLRLRIYSTTDSATGPTGA